MGAVEVVSYRETWSRDFDRIASALERVRVPEVLSIEHVGSTSVPGLAAKDVVDVQVRVALLDREHVVERFSSVGYRLRPERWNAVETTRSGPEAKLVFASPVGGRSANVHVRTDTSCGAYDTLLFRDFLRDDRAVREAWGAFKVAIVRAVPGITLVEYGQIKQPAWVVLMAAADAWASDQDWRPEQPPGSRRPPGST